MEHRDIQPGEIHAPYQWVVANQVARIAIVPASGHQNRLCLQLDTKSEWRLVSVSPVSWELASDPAGSSAAAVSAHEAGTEVHSIAGVAGLQAALDEKQPVDATTDSIAEGATNQYFTATRVRAVALTGLSLVTNAVIGATDTVLAALGKLQAQISGHLADTDNPHGVTKSHVGLSNVDNTSDANKPVSTAQQAALDTKVGKTGDSITNTPISGSTGAFTALSAPGITFPATQSVSANANTLDDYEEGAFTPTIVGGTTAGAGTYTTQMGKYTKIGNTVHFSATVAWTAHTGTGTMRLGGLPFASNAAANNRSTVHMGYCSGLSATAGMVPNGGWIEAGQTYAYLTEIATGGGTMSSLAIDPAATIVVSGHYEV